MYNSMNRGREGQDPDFDRQIKDLESTVHHNNRYNTPWGAPAGVPGVHHMG